MKKIAVIGTGVIGSGWIIRLLAHNKKVIAYDKDTKLKKKIISEIKRTWPHVKKLFNKKPKIAILGLNPHAGENGLLGSEEKNYIIPAIKTLKEKGILAFGPYSADSFFHIRI